MSSFQGEKAMSQFETECFNLYAECVTAIHNGELIIQESASDKEFHFQNWCKKRLESLGVHFDGGGRNTYPDFCLVERPEGFEIKGLAYPGREKDYDANSNVPSGFHNGRTIYYVFGRYPKDTSGYRVNGRNEYPVIDLVICHGDFLNAQHDYIHKNKHVRGFGTYGDIMIRDRKMYVVPTPFALTDGTAGLQTLILPIEYDVPDEYKCVGELKRTEDKNIVIGYSFDLRNNELIAETIPNPNAGAIHRFKAYRLAFQADKEVKMVEEVTFEENEDEDE